jgi:hypothetical protein
VGFAVGDSEDASPHGQQRTVTGVDGCAGGGVAVTLSSPAQRADDGIEIAIRY